jgi:hypothetical protein
MDGRPDFAFDFNKTDIVLFILPVGPPTYQPLIPQKGNCCFTEIDATFRQNLETFFLVPFYLGHFPTLSGRPRGNS